MTTAPTALSPSLYSIALELQAIDGELAIALDLAGSDDPEQQEQAQALIEGILRRANTGGELLRQKANAICHAREGILGRAAYLKQVAADRLAKAEREERSAERLLAYMTRMLTILHPGQAKFELPEYTISRSNHPVVDADGDVPAKFCTHKLTLTLAGDASQDALELIYTKFQELGELAQQQGLQGDTDVSTKPRKNDIKAAIKAGVDVPGAELKDNIKWSVK
jgi:hypothetical protein